MATKIWTNNKNTIPKCTTKLGSLSHVLNKLWLSRGTTICSTIVDEFKEHTWAGREVRLQWAHCWGSISRPYLRRFTCKITVDGITASRLGFLSFPSSSWSRVPVLHLRIVLDIQTFWFPLYLNQVVQTLDYQSRMGILSEGSLSNTASNTFEPPCSALRDPLVT